MKSTKAHLVSLKQNCIQLHIELSRGNDDSDERKSNDMATLVKIIITSAVNTTVYWRQIRAIGNFGTRYKLIFRISLNCFIIRQHSVCESYMTRRGQLSLIDTMHFQFRLRVLSRYHQRLSPCGTISSSSSSSRAST
jgi:hypothetical protein